MECQLLLPLHKAYLNRVQEKVCSHEMPIIISE